MRSQARRTVGDAGVVIVCVLGLSLFAAAPMARAADNEIVIRADGVQPPVFRASTGQRVEFVKRVDAPAHVEFGDDPSQHHVYQLPATGPVWAIFHRPGTHPYVVHIYRDKGTTVLHGLVEVLEDPQRPWEVGTCGAIVMENCVEP
jgi:hypothetical protein